MLPTHADDVRQEFTDYIALCTAKQGSLDALHRMRESTFLLGVVRVAERLDYDRAQH